MYGKLHAGMSKLNLYRQPFLSALLVQWVELRFCAFSVE